MNKFTPKTDADYAGALSLNADVWNGLPKTVRVALVSGEVARQDLARALEAAKVALAEAYEALADIIHENGNHWVLRTRQAYEVRRNVGTHSIDIAAFKRDADGLSCAIAYANYKAKHDKRPTAYA